MDLKNQTPKRQIKFRAWNNDRGKFYYSDKYLSLFSFFRKIDRVNVLSNTSLQQYTGLTDKNGKEIYEGDIVKHKLQEDVKGNISFYEGSFIVGIALTRNSLINFNVPNYIEIIGNIHENPELLNQNK